MSNPTFSFEEMNNIVEKMIKNYKTKMNNSGDYDTLNNYYQNALGICSTAGNLKVIDKKKYDEYVNELKAILQNKIINFYKIDLSITEKLGLDCCVRIDNTEELKALYDVLYICGKIATKMDVNNMKEFPYVVTLGTDFSEFTPTTKDYNAVLEMSKDKTLLPFQAIYKQ